MKCNKCEFYKDKSEKYKAKYEMAKSGLTKEERDILIGLICNEQTMYLIPRREYHSDTYDILEKLKIKIRTI